jgi:hypothetical protein
MLADSATALRAGSFIANNAGYGFSLETRRTSFT